MSIAPQTPFFRTLENLLEDQRIYCNRNIRRDIILQKLETALNGITYEQEAEAHEYIHGYFWDMFDLDEWDKDALEARIEQYGDIVRIPTQYGGYYQWRDDLSDTEIQKAYDL